MAIKKLATNTLRTRMALIATMTKQMALQVKVKQLSYEIYQFQ